MSRLPNAASATLADEKITRYLLDPSRSAEAAAKAQFFTAFGFSRAIWSELKRALLAHPLTNAVASQTVNPYGIKYTVSCMLASPDGRNPCVISVWIVEPPDPDPRFVTAYPGP